MVAWRKAALGRRPAEQTQTVHVSETTLAIELDDENDENGEVETRAVRRTTEQPIRSIKGQRPRTVDTSIS